MRDDDLDPVLAAHYEGARERMSVVADGLDEQQAATPVPACPDWAVTDLLAHVTALSADLGAGRRPEGDTQAWVDAQIVDRRGRSPEELVDEWSSGAPAFEAMVAEKPHRWWGLVYDVLVHEHDLRGAVGSTPDGVPADAVEVAALLGLRLVGGDLSKHDLPAFRLVLDGTAPDVHQVGEGEPQLTLTATPFEALRLLGSRRTLEQLRAARFEGDLDRYLPGLVHMALPERDLGELRR